MPSVLEKEIETFRRELPNYADQAGKFLLIRDSEVLGVWAAYEDALKEGYRACGVNQPFLVKKIELVETPLFNSRFVQPVCHR
jgi:hypothetical protein